MSGRIGISTRTRFEIFKRDKFTCLYCGKKPPAVILHVDHIVPVAEGGKNGRENLATACEECNQGKSSVPLSVVSDSIKDTLKRERELMNQMAEYNSWLREIQAAKEADFRIVSDALMIAIGENPEEQIVAGQWARTVRSLLKRLPAAEIVDAVQIADDRFSFKRQDYKTFKYFCGVCWRKVERAESGN